MNKPKRKKIPAKSFNTHLIKNSSYNPANDYKDTSTTD